MERIFVIEPGLIKSSGHPIQYALALQDFGRRSGIKVHVVCHRDVQKDVLERLDFPQPIISRTCFQFVPDGPALFYSDLSRLNESHKLNKDDHIIIASCYTKEIEGSVLFQQNLAPSRCPRIVMNFHQLFPPADVSSTVCHPEYQELWLGQLHKAFRLIHTDDSKISFWTTMSEGLNQAYKIVSGRRVGVLPFLLSSPEVYGISRSSFNFPGRIKMAFLGDGRQEKGLLILLRTIQKYFRPEKCLEFIIQNIDARGYDEDEREKLNNALFDIRHRPDTVMLEQPLFAEDFHNLISDIDVVILPYHPCHYDRRASILFVQAAVNQKPTIVSDGTWMADEIEKGNASGRVFEYIQSDLEITMNNLKQAILDVKMNLERYQLEARERAKYYRSIHTAEHYIQTIIE